MSTVPKSGRLFERLRAGLEDGVQFARGALDLRTTLAPERPPNLKAGDVVRLRQRVNMSQGIFARMLNVSPKTVQSWEQGERRPSQAALRLLQVIEAKPALIFDIVGISARTQHSNRRRVKKA
jgi:putative transcriptional regulator